MVLSELHGNENMSGMPLPDVFSKDFVKLTQEIVRVLKADNVCVWFVEKEDSTVKRCFALHPTVQNGEENGLPEDTGAILSLLHTKGVLSGEYQVQPCHIHTASGSHEGRTHYLGLKLDGIGTDTVLLEVRTTIPRAWSDSDISQVVILGNALQAELYRLENTRLQQTNTKLDELLSETGELADVGGWEINLVTENVGLTQQASRVMGDKVHNNCTLHAWLHCFAPESREELDATFKTVMTCGSPICIELRLNTKSGAPKWVKMSVKATTSTDNNVRLYGAVVDISWPKSLEAMEQDDKQYLRAILNNLHDAIVVTNSEGIIQHTNRAVTQVFGFDETELTGKNLECLMPDSYAKTHRRFMDEYLLTGKARIIGIGRELQGKKHDGRAFAMELTLSEFQQHDQRLFIGIIRDVTERKQAQETIYRLAYYNKLTGVKNRIAFDERISLLLKQSRSGHHYICATMVDIDGFARFNLAYGTTQGDLVITRVANRLQKLLPGSTEFYYNQADTFLLLHSQLIAEKDLNCLCQQHNIVNRVYSAFREPVYVNENPHLIHLTISGTRLLSQHTDPGQIIQSLELAVAEGKATGGNCFVEVDEEKNARYRHRTQLAMAIQSQTLDEEFFLVVQPQFDLNKNQCAGEVLVRWQSPLFGRVSPAEFIPVAEESDCIILVGNWVLESALKLLNSMVNNGMSLSLSVNISAKQIAQPDFIKLLERMLLTYHVPASKITLELTETTLMNDRQDIQAKLACLKHIGFHTSIDDFGTGYSSLQYLNELAIDELKIDKSFIDRISEADIDVPIVNSIIDMAKALGMTVVAEGVENSEQFEYLRSRGCDLIQGYFLSKPVSLRQWMQDAT